MVKEIQWSKHAEESFTEISDMFKNIKFCSSCELELRSCHLGEYPFLKQRLENNTKCKVTVYNGASGSIFSNEIKT